MDYTLASQLPPSDLRQVMSWSAFFFSQKRFVGFKRISPKLVSRDSNEILLAGRDSTNISTLALNGC